MTEVAVVARPDELRGEVVVAFVVLPGAVLAAPSGNSPKAP